MYGTNTAWTAPADYFFGRSEGVDVLDSLLPYEDETFVTSAAEQLEVEIHEVKTPQGLLLRRHEPLTLRAFFSDGCHSAEVPELEMPVAAYSRQELADAVNDLVGVLWEEYAMEDDAKLTKQARVLKQRLLSNYTVVP